jgi:N-acetylglutamate synthase-like GNAT family acetyltransferase
MDKLRLIEDRDYRVLSLYWIISAEGVNARDVYPAHSSYVFERDGKVLYCVGLYKVEGLPVCFAEGLIRDPSKASDFNAVKALQAHIENVASERGCKVLIAISKNESLTKHHAALGYNKVSDGAFMVKGLRKE